MGYLFIFRSKRRGWALSFFLVFEVSIFVSRRGEGMCLFCGLSFEGV